MSTINKPEFGMPIISKDKDNVEIHPDLKGRVFYLVGWDDIAFAIVKIKGSTNINFYTGKVLEQFRLATAEEIRRDEKSGG